MGPVATEPASAVTAQDKLRQERHQPMRRRRKGIGNAQPQVDRGYRRKPPPKDRVEVYPDVKGQVGAMPARPYQAPAVPMLPDALDLGRALRLLHRTVASRTHMTLDEEATVERSAEQRMLQAELRGVPRTLVRIGPRGRSRTQHAHLAAHLGRVGSAAGLQWCVSHRAHLVSGHRRGHGDADFGTMVTTAVAKLRN